MVMSMSHHGRCIRQHDQREREMFPSTLLCCCIIIIIINITKIRKNCSASGHLQFVPTGSTARIGKASSWTHSVM